MWSYVFQAKLKEYVRLSMHTFSSFKQTQQNTHVFHQQHTASTSIIINTDMWSSNDVKGNFSNNANHGIVPTVAAPLVMPRDDRRRDGWCTGAQHVRRFCYVCVHAARMARQHSD